VPEVEAQWNAGRRLLDPKGPAQTDFFRLLTGAQGTLGIVTWASVRVQLIPDPKKTLFVSAPKLDDLVDVSYRLTRLRLGDELLIVNAAYLAALLAADSAEAVELRQALPAPPPPRVGRRSRTSPERWRPGGSSCSRLCPA
jgi:FAD/FMN-containing dehydrogenase